MLIDLTFITQTGLKGYKMMDIWTVAPNGPKVEIELIPRTISCENGSIVKLVKRSENDALVWQLAKHGDQ
jgi:hypothetical protein